MVISVIRAILDGETSVKSSYLYICEKGLNSIGIGLIILTSVGTVSINNLEDVFILMRFSRVTNLPYVVCPDRDLNLQHLLFLQNYGPEMGARPQAWE